MSVAPPRVLLAGASALAALVLAVPAVAATRTTCPAPSTTGAYGFAVGTTCVLSFDDASYPVVGTSLTSTVSLAGGSFTAVGSVSGSGIGIELTSTGQLAAITEALPVGVKSFTYDASGRLVTLASAAGTTMLSYDAGGSLVGVSTAGGVTSFVYSSGRLSSVTTAAGTTAFTYDPSGRLVGALQPGVPAAFLYSGSGQLLQRTTGPDLTAFAYDSSGRLVQATSALAGITSFVYDAGGRLIESVPPAGPPLFYTYDAGGRLLMGGASSYAYDATGNLTAESGPLGTATFTYDVAGQLVGSIGPATAFAYTPPAPAKTPPLCTLAAIIPGPPKKLSIAVQDSDDGIASIDVTENANASVTVDPFAPGATGTVAVTATKIDQTKAATVGLRITDTGGSVTVCDPVIPAGKGLHKRSGGRRRP